MQTSETWLKIRYKLGWIAITIITAIPLIWTVRLIFSQGFNFDRYSLLTTFGLFEGIIGLMLYAISLILATRLKILEDYFGGLNKMYMAHHLVGGVALIFLCLHPIVLSLRILLPISQESIRQAADFLWFNPIRFSTPIGNDMAINFGLIALFGTIFLLILTFFTKLPYKLWLLTHKFLGVAFFIAALHVLFIQGTVSDDTFLRWYLLFWCGLGLLAFVYKTLAGRILIRHYDYRVNKITKPTNGVITLSLDPLSKRLDFEPGQFVFLRFKKQSAKGITTESHPFSMSSSPNEGEIRLTIKALGDYTRDLLSIKEGAIVELEGAYGKFSYKNYSNPNQVWIAGGIGITPFLSMARSIKGVHGLKVDLYYCVNKAEEMIDLEYLNTLKKKSTIHFNLIPYITEKDGLLNATVISEKSNGLEGKDFYVCGPPAMNKAIREQLRAKGIKNNKIHSEEFSMS